MLTVLISASLHAQVTPDLLNSDHFRPYLSEQEKREQLLQSKTPHAQTSKEMYPQLYQYFNEDYINPVKGTPGDPSKVFTNYSKTQYLKTTAGNSISTPIYAAIPQSVYQPGLSIQQRNQMMFDADMKAYEEQKMRSQQLVDEAMKELFTPTINYNLGLHSGSKAERFTKAYTQLQSMLNGEEKIDFVKAVWLVESALDESLSWQEFNGMFQDGVQIISQLMIQDKLSTNDNLSKIMTVFKFMSDTTKVFIRAKEKTVVSKPMLYDFDDFAGKKDVSKVFVSKLLRTGTGQCMSLPMLYFLYAKTFGADVHIAFAPQHSYVTFKDNLGNWQNIELTGRMFIATDYHWQSGFITTEQVKSGIYLRPSTDKETIAYLLTTLALTYLKTLGTDDRVLQMANTAKQYFPNNLTANMIYAGYYRDLWNNVLRQYDVFRLPEDKFNSDEQAKSIKQKAESAALHIKRDLGWREMPDWAYKKWLEGVNNLANRDQHIVRKRQLEQQLNRHK
ncbi:MAG: hypothetical protein JST69_11545 [Bacteroidetes bacterium]|nr:hypothetical protein [Bacteroidota bacterium]